MNPAPASRTHAIRTLHADEIGTDVTRFYERFATEPLIIRGIFPPEHPLHHLSLTRIEELLGDAPIQVYNPSSLGYMTVPAAEIFAGMRSGVARYNVVDHYLADTALGALFETPPFLRANWCLGAPAHFDKIEKSLMLSPAGSFTPLHLETYGMQGWAYLIAGRKSWEFYPPPYVLSLFDPIFREFYDPRKHTPEQFPMLPFVEKYVGTMQGGDLLFFPSGWIHQVQTTEASYGIGANLFNDYQIEDHMRWWLFERTFQFHGSLDLKQVILDMPAERFSGPAGHARAQSALKLCRDWEARIAEVNADAWKTVT